MSFLGGMLPGLIGAGASALGGLFGKQNQQTPIQGQQQQLIDQLLASLGGQGPYSDLFNVNEESFNQGFREPAMAQFRNQTAPQIQQSYIASGQQRGTGLEDTLSRAGVDMDMMLNQMYAQQQQQAQQNKLGTIGNILGQGPGAPNTPTSGQAMGQGFAGFLSSPQFGQSVSSATRGLTTPRRGFEADTGINTNPNVRT